jgi:DNA-binding response OmpR family regulator
MSVTEVRKAGWSYVLDEPVRVLVADDDPILREFASVHLSTPTATIVTAEDGMAAFEHLTAMPCDIAVLDIEMPKLDGLELLARIRQDARLAKLPVMMLTRHEDIGSIDRAFRLGASGFASKPVNWRLLSYQIRYVLRSCALEHQIQAAGRSVESVRRTLTEHDQLRERCEAILRDAREISADTGAGATDPRAACLQRVVTALSQIVEGDVFAKVPASAAPCLVPES